MRNHAQEYMVSAQYFAPRGKERLMFLGEQISHRHLFFNDRLIGILGDAGAGKSSFIKGMFPGLQLSNDDDIVNPRKIMQVRNPLNDIEDATTYHFDVRFQMAFMQMYEIADFVRSLLERKRRVVVEHFNLLYDALGRNADLLVGIGEEIIVARPGVFGPLPQSIYDIVHESLKYRKMAHSAEDITTLLLTMTTISPTSETASCSSFATAPTSTSRASRHASVSASPSISTSPTTTRITSASATVSSPATAPVSTFATHLKSLTSPFTRPSSKTPRRATSASSASSTIRRKTSATAIPITS